MILLILERNNYHEEIQIQPVAGSGFGGGGGGVCSRRPGGATYTTTTTTTTTTATTTTAYVWSYVFLRLLK
eukprot:gene27253-biopygen7754